MEIQIASDLHLEFSTNYFYVLEEGGFEVAGDILLLAGDIFNYARKGRFEDFMEKFGSSYRKVIVIGGNHEWYKSTWKRAQAPKSEGNLVYLTNSTYEFEGIRFIGSTMWSGASEASSKALNDYYVIDGFNVSEENKTHKRDVEFLQRELAKPYDGKTIVMTHHLPLWECIDAPFVGSPINDCFASDQSSIIRESEIDVWVHGHSHTFQDFTFHGTRVVRNPLGYQHEWGSWQPDFTIEM